MAQLEITALLVRLDPQDLLGQKEDWDPLALQDPRDLREPQDHLQLDLKDHKEIREQKGLGDLQEQPDFKARQESLELQDLRVTR